MMGVYFHANHRIKAMSRCPAGQSLSYAGKTRTAKSFLRDYGIVRQPALRNWRCRNIGHRFSPNTSQVERSLLQIDRSDPHGAYWLCLITTLSPYWLAGSHEAKDTGSTNNAKLRTTVSSQNDSLLRTCVSENSLLISWAWVGLM